MGFHPEASLELVNYCRPACIELHAEQCIRNNVSAYYNEPVHSMSLHD